MIDFTHLHVHTEYSLLDGASRIKKLIALTAELGMKSVAITDHGVMYGVLEFYKEAIKNDIKPIIGCEVYTAHRSRFDKQANIDSEQGHLVLLAKDNKGYKNLMKLVSLGFTEGYYYKPRVDLDLLGQYSEGLIALSACLSGDVPNAILQGNYERAKEIALQFKKIFGDDNFYLELQINGIQEQNLVNQKLIKLSREIEVPLVATNDVHYLKREDSKAHDVLLCIQTGKTIKDEDRMRFSSEELYFKSPEEMGSLFKSIPESIENSCKIAERCNVEFEFGKLHLPEFKVPENEDPFLYLRNLCFEGIKKLYPTPPIDDISDYENNTYSEIVERLEYELNVIKQMGYVDYFLIVWDFIKYAKDNGIMVGPGRGSAAGSLVSYALGITNIDPIKYKLIFERFLNPERISMPDIDIDFCFERRQEVIDYVIRKYGKERVAQIITFGTMAARAAIRDVGRVLDIPYNEVDLIAKMIPFQIGMNIDKALEINPELANIYEDNDSIKELIDMARKLEGAPRHASTHAAGVVISKEPIVEYVPLQKNDESITTQFTMGLLEEMGLLKMDFLGLRTLTVIRDTLELIRKNYGKNIDFEKSDLDDKNVFKLISEGKTAGVFQLESAGMKQFMKELQPSSLEDIIAGISLYRPGPMDQIPRYIKNKNDPMGVKYHHPLLENILKVTYGCMVYQEQVMQIVRDLGGYSWGRSDLVRRAMSKKKVDVMEKERQNFIYGIKDSEGKYIVDGAIRRGVDERTANIIFDEMMDFASYAFNKSHAAAYAVIAYQTAWLKNYYPTEFMAALLNSFLGSSDKVSQYVQECKALGISVLPPDINESESKFSVKNNKIRFGIAAVKNVGLNAVDEIIKDRDANGIFKSFGDFCQRICDKDINKRCIESLIKSGAFDSFGVFRSRLMSVYEKMIDGIQMNKKKNMDGQLSIFEFAQGDETADTISEDYPDLKEFEPKVLLSMEKEMLGLYISGHPLSEYENEIQSNVNFYSSNLLTEADDSEAENGLTGVKGIKDGLSVQIGGIITSKKTKTTKNNKIMAFITVEDLYGSMEVILFPKILSRFAEIIVEENIVLIKGRISMKEEEQPKIICDEVNTLKKNNSTESIIKPQSAKNTKLYLKVCNSEDAEFMESLLSVLKYFNGQTPVYLYYDKEKLVKLTHKDCWVYLNDSLLAELRERLGNENVKVV